MKPDIKTALRNKGVQIPNPDSVYVSDSVNLDRISGENVTIYAGCKILGEKTLIMKNSSIGYEAPVTLENTLVGENTHLNGGFFKGAVFAGNNTVGLGAHVREGTIFEEQASAAHTVGLKQTILFPFVTLGSLINFCDCFMAGGTSRKDHSEVGSSFIHFNYTPNQDKATPSMMGNIHQGVMLDQHPIFLGGQGGLVGPVRIGYGCITAAGSIIRKNEPGQDRLLLGGGLKSASVPRTCNVYTNISHIYHNNIDYIAGLICLKAWYHHVRPCFVTDEFSRLLLDGMQETIDVGITERIKRLAEWGEKLMLSRQSLSGDSGHRRIQQHDQAIAAVSDALQVFEKACMSDAVVDSDGAAFIQLIKEQAQTESADYITVIQGLRHGEKQMGSGWLYQMERKMTEQLILRQD